jgi:predicted RNA-binding protein (virulence factor B family)
MNTGLVPLKTNPTQAKTSIGNTMIMMVRAIIDSKSRIMALFLQSNVRVDAPAVASSNSKKDVVAGCIPRLVR